jgi:HD-GYP domain-containing protein (c-di-GMP phosphodiesterase class II)
MLHQIGYLQSALEIPYCHHEKWNGTGYPRGLKEEEIPISARIFSIVDVWDALTNDRPYRNALPHAEVIEFLKSECGKHFDPHILEAFMQLIKSAESDS